MKKVLFIVSCLLFTLAACEVDNYEAPNASVHGSILDEKTGELVGTDIQDGGSIGVKELGFENGYYQYWAIKNTGEYRNDMVFAATYDVKFENTNFYPFEEKDWVVRKGDNTRDFQVTPYLRVVNPTITKNGNIVTATFSLEGGKGTEKVKSMQLFAFTDMWVGNIVKFAVTGGTDKLSFETPEAIVAGETYTLTIDVSKNASLFKYERNYYFRIGVLADVSGVGTVKHNYSPLVVIKF
ncbi:MAG: DUF3823 domain-containing protein [Bacteroides sp.]|nr:DUF3823 domain-containing protein [Bacteroides sp.]